MTDVHKIAEAFRKMADRLDLNVEQGFGGVILAFPPDGEKPIDILILDSEQDAGQFWGVIQAKAKKTLFDLDERERLTKAGFGNIR